ncbi:bifunctional tRNA (5-methylaminomethyl-2-thiouridine)(34)-methyltransferase MnmD/FAD-dependent 5-carboxymethylaminomethyl-2-thiouridine(34) oxidoreductase MnmC [Campylobacter pinnipediorum]|uniref:bifunctional tRNA (5-methylaminomethyl-2-thiouridine)(34)-methyltransferase MnmD/FAD-dependent 5-carboxymethylaminomethyl-2-thiouridine(34) oxidoreductase MnmC n=1 Tax=Campylobacter pinnipediorum TaxID=1965231 RepID=UPI0009956D9A|nr:bifunctional tRNA (5-methylaminomethyl-2-thiouridine)(34)-methyltransferase MnmD/FAD-dependent 5-carboxymethylaminomethyl-2-thiouridine(34) oxidoreductase MnmC [Campylobacter pinnipediorum]AQW83474.1 bifunctional 5-methylaminomethyl-2-thiouridine-forming methyltransferase / FAD-dependent demodification enzyme [Campylobacter pinnipediorum subsp. pinnipediorum]AQW84995.1 bifunctional 5-methylaminomethyl-2-thiouridine-forming methyltransferase / FAD-dependent demodification enzyme [Campylobacter 
MKNADINFKENTAFSIEFDDVYFNTNKPQNESEYVFVSAIDEIWEKQDSFIVAEAGFGAGLNFLTLCKRFKNTDKKLHFVSIEGYPLSKKSLQDIYNKLGVFKRLSKDLISTYPPTIKGIHRIEFKENIILDLCFGDINEVLKELDFKADIWFLDGFSPKKNPKMWDMEVFNEISKLTKENGIIRSYSCSKPVRDGLSNFGFNLQLRAGYGKKRQMSHAVFKTQQDKEKKDIWFERSETDSKKAKDVLIIGAGVAGCVSAYKLKNSGFNVTIAEKRDKIAQNGSGNHCGILMPLITKPDVNLGKMHKNAFLQAVRFYKKSMSEKEINFSGCAEYAYDETLAQRYFLNDDSIFEFYKDEKPYPYVFIKDGAYARPRKLCKKASKNIDIKLNLEYKSHKHLKNGKISVKFKNNDTIKTDILIFTTGSESVEIFKNLPISFVRGQVTHIKPILDNKIPLSAKGYITPAIDDIQVIGATYARNELNNRPTDADNEENISKISEFVDTKNITTQGARVGYRGYSSDRFPIIGNLHDESFYKENYKDLFWTKHKGSKIKPKYQNNVFINIAHGSRGLCTAVLGANIISDLILNRPLCIEKSLFNELHPARFLIRQLKKGKLQN